MATKFAGASTVHSSGVIEDQVTTLQRHLAMIDLKCLLGGEYGRVGGCEGGWVRVAFQSFYHEGALRVNTARCFV